MIKKNIIKFKKQKLIITVISIGWDNNDNAITGNNNNNNNTIIYKFDKNFNKLINSINDSNLQNKDMILKELNDKKNNKVSLKQYLGNTFI